MINDAVRIDVETRKFYLSSVNKLNNNKLFKTYMFSIQCRGLSLIFDFIFHSFKFITQNTHNQFINNNEIPGENIKNVHALLPNGKLTKSTSFWTIFPISSCSNSCNVLPSCLYIQYPFGSSGSLPIVMKSNRFGPLTGELSQICRLGDWRLMTYVP